MVETGGSPIIAAYQEAEEKLARKVIGSRKVMAVDCGCGAGRAFDYLSELAEKVIGIEINPNMSAEAERKSRAFHNVDVQHRSVQDVLGTLSVPYTPIAFVLQNTTGVIESGEKSFYHELGDFLRANSGELIISYVKAEGLPTWGLEFYQGLETLFGQYDPGKSDLNSGLYATDTGFTSRWHSEDSFSEVVEMLGMRVQTKLNEDYFFVGHLIA